MDYLYLCCGPSGTLDAQQLSLLSQGQFEKAFLETKAGKREAFESLLRTAQAGDCVTVESFASAAASSRELLELLDSLSARGTAFCSLREAMDTRTEEGERFAALCSALLALDRKRRKERQREGIEQARQDGKYKGRKPIEVDDAAFDAVAERWRAGEITAKQAMKELGLKPNTFYRRIKAKEAST